MREGEGRDVMDWEERMGKREEGGDVLRGRRYGEREEVWNFETVNGKTRIRMEIYFGREMEIYCMGPHNDWEDGQGKERGGCVCYVIRTIQLSYNPTSQRAEQGMNGIETGAG